MIVRSLFALAFACCALAESPAAKPPSCAKVGDTVTVRGVFVSGGFMPHSFPGRTFCVDFIAPTHTAQGLSLPPLDPQLAGLLIPELDSQVQLPFLKYVEVTGKIVVPRPTQPGQVVRMPSIHISKMTDVDAEVYAAARAWLTGCYEWQDGSLAAFSKGVPGATVERMPPSGGLAKLNQDVKQNQGLYEVSIRSENVSLILNLQRCALSATPVSKVLIPPPQPVVLVRPEPSVPVVVPESTSTPPVEAGNPTSGVLCNGPVNLPQNGELVFKNLPHATLMIKFDHSAWQPSFYLQPDGLRTLVMRSLKPGIQTHCDMQWKIDPTDRPQANP